ncbi:MAG: GDSL-type esterase/lipase family protein, partial [Verrucomicrobiota bacterium]
MKFLLRPALSLLLMLCLPASAETPNLGIPDKDDGMAGTGPVRRYDWFRGLWNEKRAAWAKRLEADRGAVVFLGDSITQGWGDDFGGSFPGMKAANRGISGDTTRGMLHRLEHDVLALQPAAVVLLMGT